MTDILKKLKTYKKDEPEDVYVIINELLQLCREAADEIERLREQVLALQHIADRDEERIDRLRKALKSITKTSDCEFAKVIAQAALGAK